MRVARLAWLMGCVALAACASKPERIADDRLSGTWRNAEGASLAAEDTGVFTLLRPGPKQRPIVGEYTFDGESAVFTFRAESRLCGGDPGTYALKIAEGSFDATAVRDPCADRRKVIEGTWTRTAAARLTPES